MLVDVRGPAPIWTYAIQHRLNACGPQHPAIRGPPWVVNRHIVAMAMRFRYPQIQ